MKQLNGPDFWRTLENICWSLERRGDYPYNRQEKPGIKAVLEWSCIDPNDGEQIDELQEDGLLMSAIVEQAYRWDRGDDPLPEAIW